MTFTRPRPSRPRSFRLLPLALGLTWTIAASCVQGQPATDVAREPASAPDEQVIRFPSVLIDRAARQVRVDCQALAIDAPLEFFCVANGGPEHEAVLRTPAKPSHIHAGLLMLGQEPGSPMTYSDATKKWTPPFGPPIRVSVEFENADGQRVTVPATKLMRHVRTHEPAPPITWVFAGSRQREDGAYLADLTGYVVSIVNFEHTLIDVPQLASAANDTLEWEIDPKAGLVRGGAVTMVLEPIDGPTTRAASDADKSKEPLGGSTATDVPEIAALRQQWRDAVKPHEAALQEAARTHYQVIDELRRRQHALIDEADRLQRLIDELEREYAEMTTPKPQ